MDTGWMDGQVDGWMDGSTLWMDGNADTVNGLHSVTDSHTLLRVTSIYLNLTVKVNYYHWTCCIFGLLHVIRETIVSL